ncbi:receptor-like protein kinase 5-like [Tripterygium wilfordii]|uniref:non-specific serine/threonine protein kinase n=1 Tax=Tripterygium wilfordii TaxID=458696 RepID=A0A7J7DDE6_TRIWF|nr:receptor-like protein kinase HSL1 [Tripterygium wilfordii]KAF5744096.1 receptor-like protein kinase 5-like [Tripterygium wilfordii]
MVLFLLLLHLFALFFSGLCLNQEGLYLQQVKQSLSDPTQSLSSWNERDETPCNWFGITCDNTTRRVVSVNLSNSGLSGPFPGFLCRLPFLSSVNFSANEINSSLVVDVDRCHNLQELILSDNLLVGSIPESLSLLQNLRVLDLAGNNFSGGIPASFGQFRRLESLSVAGNLLNGTTPSSLGNISTLVELLLAYNPFTPIQIPSELGNLSSLENFWLADCDLVGSIPESLGRLTRLTNLDVSQNRLTGSIPRTLSGLKSIVQIELYNNNLSGEIPPSLGNLTTLRRFDASGNGLNGTIPNELCELPLESLNLFENQLHGAIPESIANSPNLYELKLFNNTLSGRIPNQLGNNSNLVSLDLASNQLYGEIPDHLCAKGSLVELVLIYNSFSGKIPESLGKCGSLNRVRLRNNRLSGTVPDMFWGLPHAYLFELSDNLLTGDVSKTISRASNLSLLLISRNQFNGSIPEEIGLLSALVEFSASGNMFTGSIPGSFVKLSQLSKLDLSHNELNGEMPVGIQDLKSLNELSLANNKLSGDIPSEIGSLPVLNYLDLSGNDFSGSIPLELQNLKLNLLNLSNNRLSGDLPPLYAKEIYKNSFVGNPGLCGDLADLCPRIGESKNKLNMWILRSIFILAGAVFIIGVVWFFFKYRSIKKVKQGITISKWRSFHKLGFGEFEIVDSLKEDNVIGSGASGKVYKVVLSNGETVAVKKLWGGTKKDDASANSPKDEYEVEVETLGKIRHKNIVRLWCCCNTGVSKLLVYEYMPNGSLGDLLNSSKGGLLGWPKRYKIALDAAEGLSYLHHDCVPPIVHRDVKSNNILLDAEFGARVADFGVAKVVDGVGKGAESMSVIAGSCGYIAPEYAYTLKVNEKSDIYSFGVVMLELVTGRRPIDPEFGEKDLVKWVYTILDQKGIDHVIDPNLDSSYKEEICRVLEVALCCTNSLPINRPSMRRVVKMLQEAGAEKKLKTGKKDGKLSPYYYEDESAASNV